jgi:hypothetical protein
MGASVLEPFGITGVLSSLAAAKATVLYRLGGTRAMQDAIGLAQRTGASDDILTQALERAIAEHNRKGNLVDGGRLRNLLSA